MGIKIEILRVEREDRVGVREREGGGGKKSNEGEGGKKLQMFGRNISQ